MKWSLQSLIAILFIISTITTSLHELSPHHSSSDCQVCTMVQNDHGLSPELQTPYNIEHIRFETPQELTDQYRFSLYNTFKSRAPPSFS